MTPRAGGTVYFVSAPDRIKIGYTRQLEHRLRQLGQQCLDPLTVIATIPGNRELEREIHRQLERYRIKGEWFEDCDSVWALMSELVDRAEKTRGLNRIMEKAANPHAARIEAARDEAANLIRLAAAGAYASEIGIQIARAASRLGWTYRRAEDIWRREARRIDSWEMDMLRALTRAHESERLR